MKASEMLTIAQRKFELAAEFALEQASEGENYGPALNYMSDATGCNELLHWSTQPGRTHLEVMTAFDTAIALAITEGQ